MMILPIYTIFYLSILPILIPPMIPLIPSILIISSILPILIRSSTTAHYCHYSTYTKLSDYYPILTYGSSLIQIAIILPMYSLDAITTAPTPISISIPSLVSLPHAPPLSTAYATLINHQNQTHTA